MDWLSIVLTSGLSALLAAGLLSGFVDISGSYSGVVGLPVFETAALLAKAGLDILPMHLDRLHAL